MSQSWFSKGSDEHTEESQKARSGGGFDVRDIWRWYIPKSDTDEEKRLIFLDDEPFNCWMHHYEANGRWGNWETCIKKNGAGPKCPLCERDSKVYTGYIGHYTVIDKTGWEKDGEHFMSLKILPAKSERVQLLEKERSRKGTLIGAEFAVERTEDAKDNTGNYWSYVDRIDLTEFLKENIAKLKKQLDFFPEEWGFWKGPEDNRKYFLKQGLPFEDILEPKSYDALAKKIGAPTGGVSATDGGGSQSEVADGGFGYDPDEGEGVSNPGY